MATEKGTMNLDAAFAEIVGINRVAKTFAQAEEVLAAAVAARQTQAEKDRILAETQREIDAAQRQVRILAAELADATAAHHAALQKEATLAQQDQAAQAARLAVAAKDLAAQEQAVLLAKRAAETALATLAETQARTAALVEAEKRKVQEAGAATLAELNAQAFALQTTINQLKLQLRTTMDSAGRLL